MNHLEYLARSINVKVDEGCRFVELPIDLGGVIDSFIGENLYYNNRIKEISETEYSINVVENKGEQLIEQVLIVSRKEGTLVLELLDVGEIGQESSCSVIKL